MLPFSSGLGNRCRHGAFAFAASSFPFFAACAAAELACCSARASIVPALSAQSESQSWDPASEPAAGADAIEEAGPKPASRKPTRKAPYPEPEEPRVVESVEDLGV